jgi:hypothetical protein
MANSAQQAKSGRISPKPHRARLNGPFIGTCWRNRCGPDQSPNQLIHTAKAY